MKDSAFEDLKKRFFIGLLVALIFCVPLAIFFARGSINGKVLNKLNKDESFVLLISSKECEKCSLVEDILDNKNINYEEINNYSTTNYEEIMLKLKITNKDESFPVLVYIEDGETKAYLNNISNEGMVNDFLKFHKLSY